MGARVISPLREAHAGAFLRPAALAPKWASVEWKSAVPRPHGIEKFRGWSRKGRLGRLWGASLEESWYRRSTLCTIALARCFEEHELHSGKSGVSSGSSTDLESYPGLLGQAGRAGSHFLDLPRFLKLFF